MSYVNATVSPAERAKATVSVIAIHAMIGAGVVLGLAVSGASEKIITVVDGFNVPEDLPEPPPPPPPEPQASATPRSDVRVPDRRVPIPDTTSNFAKLMDDAPIGDVTPFAGPIGNDLGPIEIPTPAPRFSPVGVSPRNNISGWITNNDYPSSELRRGNEGMAQYRLVVGTDGRVDACEITRSTGHARLDRVTCDMIERRARFNPAKDETGATVVGTYSGNVTWQIPE